MKIIRILLNFLQFSDSKLETFAGTVLLRMTGNPYFPNPMPSLQVLEAVRQNYAAALVAAKSRDADKVQEKKEAKKQLQSLLRQLANYITGIGNGNKTIYVSSGYHVSAETPSRIALGEIENFTVTLGTNSGEVNLSITVKGARFYTFLYALYATENIVWEHDSDTVSTITITGLIPGKTYLFRAIAKGTGRQRAETVVITKIVV